MHNRIGEQYREPQQAQSDPTTQPITIMVQLRGSGYRAFLQDCPEIRGDGATQAEAIGNMILEMQILSPHMYAINIETD